MHTFTNPAILLILSVVLSGVQGRVARPRSPAGLVCYEDNELRSLERFSSYADDFCPEYLSTGKKPRWLNQWNGKKVSSACECYEKTATSLGPTSTSGLAIMSTAPPALTAVFAIPSASTESSPSSTSVPAVTHSASASASSVSSSSSIAIPSPVVSSSASVIPVVPKAVATSTPSSSTSASATLSQTATTASESIAPTESSELTPMSPSLPAGDTYPPQPFGAGPGKRGLVYDYTTQDGWSAFFKGSEFATYGSNWGLDPSVGDLDASFSYVPTIVVDSTLSNSDWNTNVPVLIEGGTKALFASNEPDNAAQANLDVSDCVTVYKKYMQPYYGQVQLGTPAVTNGGGETGLTYLSYFVGNCTDCSFNFVNVHHYIDRSLVNTTQYTQALKDYITIDVPAVQAQYKALEGLPIYIGEWWLWNASEDEGSDLMDDLLPWLDGNSNVLGYQAFGGLWEGNFINDAGTGLTPAGSKYKTMTAAPAAATA